MLSRGDTAAIAVGGALGASLRSWIGELFDADSVAVTVGTAITGFEPANGAVSGVAPMLIQRPFPTATLVANVLGCFILGALVVLLRHQTSVPRRALVAAATGFCGSLTTFSSFAVEIALALRNWSIDVDGGAELQFSRSVPQALTYLIVSILLGGLAFWGGRILARTGRAP